MDYLKVDTAKSGVNFILVHYETDASGKKYSAALTIDFANRDALSAAYPSVFANSAWIDFDEGNGKAFHDRLHANMLQYLRSVGSGDSHIDTLTDFHQHWVEADGEQRRQKLPLGTLIELLKKLNANGFIKRSDIIGVPRNLGNQGVED